MLLALKALHILSAALFFGTGLGSAWYKLRAGLQSDLAVIAWVDAEVVRADWIFTIPSGLLLPLTGLGMVHLLHLPLSTPWIAWALGGYGIAGLTWLPAAALQLRMRRLSAAARDAQSPLPAAWTRAQLQWALLGIPSFLAAASTIWVMVTKQIPFQ